MNRSLKVIHVLGFPAYDRVEEDASSFIGAAGTAFYAEAREARAAGNVAFQNQNGPRRPDDVVLCLSPCTRTLSILLRQQMALEGMPPRHWKVTV